MTILWSVVILSALLSGICDAFVSRDDALAMKTWRRAASLHPEYATELVLDEVDCDAVDSRGNTTCIGCIKNLAVPNEEEGTACVSVTSRLEVMEVFVEVFDKSGVTILQEILSLKTKGGDYKKPRTNKKELAMFREPILEMYPVHVIQKLHGTETMKFCVDIAFTDKWFGGRWCYFYNGERLTSLSKNLLLGQYTYMHNYSPVKYNEKKSLWEQAPFIDAIMS